jgi:hypothetical protein
MSLLMSSFFFRIQTRYTTSSTSFSFLEVVDTTSTTPICDGVSFVPHKWTICELYVFMDYLWTLCLYGIFVDSMFVWTPILCCGLFVNCVFNISVLWILYEFSVIFAFFKLFFL